MIKILDVIKHLETLAPTHLACDWDNVGLIVGSEDNEVKKIMVTLDVDTFVVDEAIENGVNLIISHHPIMFSPINKIVKSNKEQEMIMKLIKNDISLYSAHTNLDVANGGLNDLMAQKLEFDNTKILDVVGSYENNDYGFGRIVNLKTPVKLIDIVEKCKNAFNLDVVKYCGDENRLISNIAFNTGGGTSCIQKCYENNIDLFITGDFKYSIYRDSYQNGLAVIDAGHYSTEIYATELFDKHIKQKFDNIPIIYSKKNIDIVKTYE